MKTTKEIREMDIKSIPELYDKWYTQEEYNEQVKALDTLRSLMSEQHNNIMEEIKKKHIEELESLKKELKNPYLVRDMSFYWIDEVFNKYLKG